MCARIDVSAGKTSPAQPTTEHDAGNDAIAPAIDICETETGWLVIADMPGVSKDNVEVGVERGVLTISGQVGGEAPQGRIVYRGFQRTDYFRSLALSDEIDRSKITANHHNGVLTIVLPRAEAAQTRKIVVESGE